jgi:two-component sensor histidine kinase/putative methionine-R-sulfoxide reductase with GAF domain
VNRTARHLRLLSETVAALTSSLDVREVAAAVAAAVAHALETDACFVYVYDDSSGDLVLHATYGTSTQDLTTVPRMRPGEGLTGHAASTRQPVAVAADAHLDPRFKAFPNLSEDRFQSLLAVPILDRRDRLAGAMNVRTVAAREYADDEVELLETIAAQVAQAIENARLYERARRRVDELEALARISEAVSQSLYQEEALASIVATAAGAAHAECCALVLGTEDALRVAHRSTSAGPDDATLADLARRAPLDEPGRMGVPLVWKSRRIGALVCTRDAPGGFTREERTLLDAVAHQAATAVESGRGVMRLIVAQEIHHRVKNNLQTVASLLRLRASAPGDPARALHDSVDRVLSIAEVHDLLTASREGAVDLADLVRRLAAMLGQGLGTAPTAAALTPVEVPGEVATPVALIFSELYANALEHGGGEVAVELAREGAETLLVVRDRGPGLPPAFEAGGSLGLRIAQSLAADDLGGSLVLLDAAPGVRAELRWPDAGVAA